MSSSTSAERKRFDELFQQVTGIDPDDAETNEDGWLFIPLECREADPKIRKEMSRLAGDQWKNHLVNDDYAGFWFKRPD